MQVPKKTVMEENSFSKWKQQITDLYFLRPYGSSC